MLKIILSFTLTIILLTAIIFSPVQAFAESVHAMNADELEAYIAYLQIVLQNKRKEDGNPSTLIMPQATEMPIEEKFNVIFNEKIYTGTYEGDEQDDKPNGIGTFVGYYQQNKLVYTGQWVHGEMIGTGTVEADMYTLHFDITEGIFDRTGSYTGDVVNGLPEGTGTFKIEPGTGNPWKYTGEWKNGMFNGQGTQTWEEESTVKTGTFTDNEFTPTPTEAFAYTARQKEYSISVKSKTALAEYASCFTGQQQIGIPEEQFIDADFDLKQYKKRPDDYGDKLIYVSKAKVFQVLTWEIGDKLVEQILMETEQDDIYYGFYYGKSNIVEDMEISAYVLPLDWDTYKNVSDTEVWAVFCAITDFAGDPSFHVGKKSTAHLAGPNLGDVMSTRTIAANSHAVAITTIGTVHAVGNNSNGQCNVDNWKDIISVDVGELVTIGLKSNGTVVSAGDNSYGQRDVKNWTNITAVAAGYWHTLGLKSDGSVVSVGYNGFGQRNVKNWRNIIAIAAGSHYSVGLKSNGTVVAVGTNDDGQCNVGTWRDIVAIDAGIAHVVGLTSYGTVVATGWNRHGQLNVNDWENIVAVAAGQTHTVGLVADGTVVATGGSGYGECDVGGWKDIVAIAAGVNYTIGLKSDGTLVMTGDDFNNVSPVLQWENISGPTIISNKRVGNATIEYKPLKQGNKGDEVLAMKERLRELGYFIAGSNLNNQYSATTTERVKLFQKVNGLNQTGIADEETLLLLFSFEAKKNPY